MFIVARSAGQIVGTLHFMVTALADLKLLAAAIVMATWRPRHVLVHRVPKIAGMNE